MFSTHTRRWTVVALSAMLLAVSTPAFASQDAGTVGGAKAHSSTNCPLTRMGTQFVHCDNLTGNGVLAPSWVHED
jgi:hypothetical protein